MSVLVLNNENFQNEISSGVVLVDFWAEWCGPCQMMLPILADFASEMWDKMKVGKVNVDEVPALAQQFGIRSIPTLLIFKNWELVDSPLIWVKQKEELKKICAKYL